jgi:purine-nucleoside phosphorylase
MATPHISCEPGDIAPLVVMPGDPRRAERIARTRLDGARLVSEVRGMGVPSLSIYATELYTQYGVRRICRVGTCGGISRDVAVSDVIVASSAHTNSAVATFGVPGVTLSLAASFDMLRGAVDQARGSGARVHVGPVFTSDFFYGSRADVIPALGELGTLGVEMEAAGLYACALEGGREALTVLTVTDHLLDGSGDLTAEERETQFQGALEAAIAGLLA